MATLRIPFSFNVDGTAQTLEHMSNPHKAQEIGVFVKTSVGERPLFPNYGTTDPTFSSVNPDEFATSFVEFYGSDISLTSLDIVKSEGATVQVKIGFD